jgi:hypothetical protein
MRVVMSVAARVRWMDFIVVGGYSTTAGFP